MWKKRYDNRFNEFNEIKSPKSFLGAEKRKSDIPLYFQVVIYSFIFELVT